MKLFHHSAFGPPCRHMKGLLHTAADGSSSGFAHWFARNHASRCLRCGRYLHTLEEMIEELRSKREEELPPEIALRLGEVLREAKASLSPP